MLQGQDPPFTDELPVIVDRPEGSLDLHLGSADLRFLIALVGCPLSLRP